MVDSESSYWSF